MRLSFDHTWVRIAALPENVILRLLQEYPTPDGRTPLTVDNVKHIESVMEKALPGKGGLVTEWMLDSLSIGYTYYPHDLKDFVMLATWYFTYQKEPLFRKVVEEYSAENGRNINPKNIMDFEFGDMRDVMGRYKEAERDARINKFPESLPEGADLFYDDGNHKVIKVTDTDAACKLGQGTKWCTKEEGSAGNYLNFGPLFVIYRNREKIAQMYLGDGKNPSLIEIKNLKNRTWTPDPEIRQVLIKSGLMADALDILVNDPLTKRIMILRLLGTQDDPTLRRYCSGDPWLSYYYAAHVLHGRFFEGEREILLEPDVLRIYVELLKKNDSRGYQGFIEDHSEFTENRGENIP